MKEVMVCKFDNDIECDLYLCEEDSSVIEWKEADGITCPLNKKLQELEIENYNLKKQLNSVKEKAKS